MGKGYLSYPINNLGEDALTKPFNVNCKNISELFPSEALLKHTVLQKKHALATKRLQYVYLSLFNVMTNDIPFTQYLLEDKADAYAINITWFYRFYSPVLSLC